MGQILLVRHGQASFGADDYDVLSPLGWEQGRALGVWLREAGVSPTAVVRGGLRRHRETYEAMCEGAGWSLDASVDTDWDEFDHVGIVATHPGLPGGGEMVDRKEFQRAFEVATAAWIEGSHEGDFESYAGFVTRVRGAMSRVVSACGSGETIVVVTSGGTLGVVCADLVSPETVADQAATGRLWSRFNTVAVNSGFTRVVAGSTGARLLTFNEHPHAVGELLSYR